MGGPPRPGMGGPPHGMGGPPPQHGMGGGPPPQQHGGPGGPGMMQQGGCDGFGRLPLLQRSSVYLRGFCSVLVQGAAVDTDSCALPFSNLLCRHAAPSHVTAAALEAGRVADEDLLLLSSRFPPQYSLFLFPLPVAPPRLLSLLFQLLTI
jgi:hypothetical protein